MNRKVLCALFMSLLSCNYICPVKNELMPSIEQNKQSMSENLLTSIVKKIKNGDSLDRDEVAFVNTLGISVLTFGILNGYLATTRLHLSFKESLYASAIGAGLGFIAGLPAAYFNYYEWND